MFSFNPTADLLLQKNKKPSMKLDLGQIMRDLHQMNEKTAAKPSRTTSQYFFKPGDEQIYTERHVLEQMEQNRKKQELEKMKREIETEKQTEKELYGAYHKVVLPIQRQYWKEGTHVQIREDNGCQWFHGTITKIYINWENEEMLDVLYYTFDGNVKFKSVRRKDLTVKSPHYDSWRNFELQQKEKEDISKVYRGETVRITEEEKKEEKKEEEKKEEKEEEKKTDKKGKKTKKKGTKKGTKKKGEKKTKSEKTSAKKNGKKGSKKNEKDSKKKGVKKSEKNQKK